jgi:hypothetical protein
MTVRIEDTPPEFSDSSAVIAGGKPFATFGESLPEDASHGFAFVEESPVTTGDGAMGSSSEGGDSPAPKRKIIRMSKQMKKAVDKFKERVASFPALYFSTMAQREPEWALTTEEQEMITDSISLAFEMLDIEFAFEPLSIQLTSIWWIIAYPFIAFGFIFFSKKSLVEAKYPKEETK